MWVKIMSCVTQDTMVCACTWRELLRGSTPPAAVESAKKISGGREGERWYDNGREEQETNGLMESSTIDGAATRTPTTTAPLHPFLHPSLLYVYPPLFLIP